MPWCPNCKAEYQQGFTVCSDCKIELVDDIKEAEVLIPFFQAEDKKVAEKLVKFFQYSDLNSSCEYDEENEVYIVSIPPKKQMQAKKLYQAFYYVERERLVNGDSDLVESNKKNKDDDSVNTDLDNQDSQTADVESNSEDAYENQSSENEDDSYDENDNSTPSDEVTAFDEEEEQPGVYVMKEDQYKDLTGTVWVFLLFGIAGLIFVILNIVGTLTFLNGWIPITVMGTLFLVFIYIALSTNKKAKQVQAEIDAENKLTEEINEWLKQNLTESFLSSLRNESISDELNYIKMTDTLKEMLVKEFGPQNLAYLDRLIEEFYSENFDQE